MRNYPRGSEWRKWDLHVHTPCSIINHYSGTNEYEKWEKFISDLEKLPKEFKVIGINDYLFIDGYKKVLEYKKNGRLQNIDLILPVLEFRIAKFAGHKELKRVNFHVIFSDELSPDIIQSQFLNALTAKYKLSPGLNKGIWNGTITKDSLKDLGREIKKSIPEDKLDQYGEDLEEGFNNLNLNEEDIFQILNSNSYLKDRFLTAIGKTEWESLSWNDQSIAEKKDIINKVNFVFTSSESVDAFMKAKNKLKEQGVNDLLLDCSDAHNNMENNHKDRVGKCYTWIKADPTFEGLKQIIYEPEERVFIGEEPDLLQRAREYRTKFIRSLKINQVSEYDETQGIWFKDNEIPFSPGLVAIIGNKGSGKSAIVDILGLCGNSYQYKDFSFLKEDRFLKSGLAQNFIASLEWEDGSVIEKSLSDKPDNNAPERVRYLPQSFFEKLTNEIETREFPKTLENIVFSYLPEDQRLKASSFQELIKIKQEAIENKIKFILEDIDKLNEEIIKLEKKQHPSYRKELEEKLKLKKKELEEHRKNKPKEIKHPKEDESSYEDQQKLVKELEKHNKEIEKLEKEINEKRETLNKLTLELEELRQLLKNLEVEKYRIEKFKNDSKHKVEKFGLNIDTIISFEINTQELVQKINERNSQIKEIQKLLLTPEEIEKKGGETKILSEENLYIKKEKNYLKIKEVKEKLSERERKYQEYLENLKKWEKTEKEITGDESKVDTIKWLEKQLEFVESGLNKELASLREQRLKKALEIYEGKNEFVKIYRQFKKAVDEKTSSHRDILGEYEITIESVLHIKKEFITKFLSYINQKFKGSFYGKEEGEGILKKILNDVNINSKEDVQKLLEDIINLLELDHREAFKEKAEEEKMRYPFEQIKELKEFYKYLFSLEYIEPIYELKLGTKSISQLSPGEKGALLIVFYLMLDKDDIPLIVDQPEENLDNESVYKVLTNFIKLAKKRRQIIMVTHNPNLAIVGDAEQIIFVNIDKKNGNKFSFEAGSIEAPVINKHASDVLEGTLTAFDLRRLKYFKFKEL